MKQVIVGALLIALIGIIAVRVIANRSLPDYDAATVCAATKDSDTVPLAICMALEAKAKEALRAQDIAPEAMARCRPAVGEEGGGYALLAACLNAPMN